MKVVYVSREYWPSYRAGGIASYVYDSARWLAANGHKPVVICASDDVRKSSDENHEGVRVIRLSGGDFFIGGADTGSRIKGRARAFTRYKTYRRAVAETLGDVTSEEKPDIVEFPEFGNEALCWLDACVEVPWVVRLHGPTILDRRTGRGIPFHRSPLRWLYGELEIMTLRKAPYITSPSKALAKSVKAIANLESTEIEVIPNAIDPGVWESSISRRDHGERKPWRIMFAGTIAESKGCGELIEAAQILKRDGYNLELHLCGAMGRYGKKLSKTKDNINHWINFKGRLSRTELANEYGNADIVALPSWWEPFGLVCVEAMAAGALVIGSSAGGMAEIIDEGKSGFLVSPRDPLLLAEKISRVLALPERTRNAIRLSAVDAVRARFSLDTVMRRQIRYYERCMIHYQKRR